MGGVTRGLVSNVQDYEIVFNGFEIQSCYYIHFRINALRKGMNLLVPYQLRVKYYHYFFTSMTLALNNPQSWYAIKKESEPKPNNDNMISYYSQCKIVVKTDIRYYLLPYSITLKHCNQNSF